MVHNFQLTSEQGEQPLTSTVQQEGRHGEERGQKQPEYKSHIRK